MEVSEQKLLDKIGNQYALLMRHENYSGLTLKTRVMTTAITEATSSDFPPEYGPSYRVTVIWKIVQDAVTAQDDFQCNGNMARLERVISQYESAMKAFPKDTPALPWVLSDLGSCLSSSG